MEDGISRAGRDKCKINNNNNNNVIMIEEEDYDNNMIIVSEDEKDVDIEQQDDESEGQYTEIIMIENNFNKKVRHFSCISRRK